MFPYRLLTPNLHSFCLWHEFWEMWLDFHGFRCCLSRILCWALKKLDVVVCLSGWFDFLTISNGKTHNNNIMESFSMCIMYIRGFLLHATVVGRSCLFHIIYWMLHFFFPHSFYSGKLVMLLLNCCLCMQTSRINTFASSHAFRSDLLCLLWLFASFAGCHGVLNH